MKKLKLEELGAQIKKMQAQYDELMNEPEFEYPLLMKSKETGQIARFDGLEDRTTVWPSLKYLEYEVGDHSTHSIAHTVTDVWQPVPYDKERGLWHGQPVMVWDDADTHERRLRFYDAVNECAFDFEGESDGYPWNNIEPVKPEHYEPWMYKAYETLEGINDPS